MPYISRWHPHQSCPEVETLYSGDRAIFVWLVGVVKTCQFFSVEGTPLPCATVELSFLDAHDRDAAIWWHLMKDTEQTGE